MFDGAEFVPDPTDPNQGATVLFRSDVVALLN